MDKKQDAKIEINYPKLETDMPDTGVYMSESGSLYYGKDVHIFRELDSRFYKERQELKRLECKQKKLWLGVSIAYALLTFLALGVFTAAICWQQRGIFAVGGEWILVSTISAFIGWLVYKLDASNTN